MGVDTVKTNRFADLLKGNLKLEGLELYKAIVENRKIGEQCEIHNFNIPINSLQEKRLTEKYQCSNCGTVVDYSEKRMYELGLKHGKTK